MACKDCKLAAQEELPGQLHRHELNVRHPLVSLCRGDVLPKRGSRIRRATHVETAGNLMLNTHGY
jgi:hypothetical protein